MLNPIKINNFYSAKDCKRMKRKITDWENIRKLYILQRTSI